MEMVDSKNYKLTFWITSGALLAALILSFISYLDLCTDACKAGHDWHLFSLPFGPLGIMAFSSLLILHSVSYFYPKLRFLVSLALALALGGEVILIAIQKYKMDHFCPVCLGVAASLAIGALAQLIPYFNNLIRALKSAQKGVVMNYVKKGISTSLAFLAGLLLFSFGVAKENKLEAMENSVKEQIIFGKTDSPISAYLFTDWACPACRALEPRLPKLMPLLTKNTRMMFVDIPVHPETLNYSPYNLAFMINNKEKYLDLRDALTLLSTKTGAPTEADIAKIAREYHTNFKELNYADVALTSQHWKELSTQFKIEATPTLVIVNSSTKKGKKLEGIEEINEKNILNALKILK